MYVCLIFNFDNMESIKETELNLQREVVTTVPNTWLVEAVNPSTGEKKMIDIANYASVVAENLEINTLKRRTKSGSSTQGTPLNLGAIRTAFVQIRYNFENKASLYFIASNNIAYKLCGNLSDGLSVSVNDNGELIVENTIGGSFWLNVDILIL